MGGQSNLSRGGQLTTPRAPENWSRPAGSGSAGPTAGNRAALTDFHRTVYIQRASEQANLKDGWKTDPTPQSRPIRFRCPTCRTLLGLADRMAGEEVACPRCGQRVLAPAQRRPPEPALPGDG